MLTFYDLCLRAINIFRSSLSQITTVCHWWHATEGFWGLKFEAHWKDVSLFLACICLSSSLVVKQCLTFAFSDLWISLSCTTTIYVHASICFVSDKGFTSNFGYTLCFLVTVVFLFLHFGISPGRRRQIASRASGSIYLQISFIPNILVRTSGVIYLRISFLPNILVRTSGFIYLQLSFFPNVLVRTAAVLPIHGFQLPWIYFFYIHNLQTGNSVFHPFLKTKNKKPSWSLASELSTTDTKKS